MDIMDRKDVDGLIRGIRGATQVDRDEAHHILERTQELLLEMARANDIRPEDMSSICFTMTPDLHATFPAEAARQIGWQYVPVICMRELDVPHGLPMTVRILMQAETQKSQEEIRHIYQYGAVVLREDLVKSREESQG
ncbi:chorismate mutase [Sulfobacillus thermosulfidooxidans DSM 9293]|uniref:chorismate mutase n=2 Tax=Sulfobacillus thermosulfidooxidans TaxID=28034 RepID=A0A1W1WJR0_SULTA|nr:chorismate mutase [Sulfobacillus thermosulfidooxidans DSM 9293]